MWAIPVASRCYILQDISEWKVNILWGDSVGHCEKNVYMNMV